MDRGSQAAGFRGAGEEQRGRLNCELAAEVSLFPNTQVPMTKLPYKGHVAIPAVHSEVAG
jgi:hypothetical protein